MIDESGAVGRELARKAEALRRKTLRSHFVHAKFRKI
jgi:hypothetical protein